MNEHGVRVLLAFNEQPPRSPGINEPQERGVDPWVRSTASLCGPSTGDTLDDEIDEPYLRHYDRCW